jgi:hypothetical protein
MLHRSLHDDGTRLWRLVADGLHEHGLPALLVQSDGPYCFTWIPRLVPLLGRDEALRR